MAEALAAAAAVEAATVGTAAMVRRRRDGKEEDEDNNNSSINNNNKNKDQRPGKPQEGFGRRGRTKDKKIIGPCPQQENPRTWAKRSTKASGISMLQVRWLSQTKRGAAYRRPTTYPLPSKACTNLPPRPLLCFAE